MDEKKVREAIERVKNFPEWNRDDLWLEMEDMEELTETILEALEKQLQKKPIDKSCVKDNDTIYGYVGICPSCNGIVDDSMIVCDCTQVLDWSE